MMRNWLAPLLAMLLPFQAEALEVRFFPAGKLYTYELAAAQGASSLLIHNIAVINDGSAPVTVTEVQIELMSGGRVTDVRTLGATDLARSAQAGSQLQAAGMLEPLAFMFGGERLLPAGTKLPPTALLAPGEAILISTQVFSYRGPRDQLRVRATGEGTVREMTRAIEQGGSKTVFALPVKGVWSDAAGASLHSPHRWVPMEQFAHDLIQLGPNLKSHKGDGTRFSHYYGYGKPVIAGAAGVVTAAVDGEKEDATAMRRKGETMEAYMARLQTEQMARLSKGPLGIVGNHVMIDHGNSEYSLYAHLKPGSVKVKAGDRVAQGAVIGAVGSSGNSTEPHLHFHVCDAPDVLMCGGIPPTWRGLGFALDEFPREPQTGDLIYDLQTPK